MTDRPAALVFPFGSQYLRGLTPARGDWASDMAAMRAAGFNTIRAWLVWGVLEPAPGQIDFGYVDEFLQLAHRNDLSVGFLFHLHGCPEWAIREHSDCWYVDIHGRPFEPSQRANTPSGGWPGLCPDWDDVQALEDRFISEVVRHVGTHPALGFWEPINEPHMWVDLAQSPPGPFCYCEATREAFRRWLRGRYGSLEAVGDTWGRRFSSWEDVRPPTWCFGLSDWIDWRAFTIDNIAALVERRAGIIRGHSQAPVIAHAWGGGCVTCPQLGAMAFDDWRNADPVDMWGYSAFPSQPGQTLMVGLGTDATRNAAQGKVFWQSELGAGDYGSGFDRSGRIRPEVEAMFCWESIRHGAKGLLFWQYRKEAHGSEMGAFGLTDYAGGPTELLDAVARVGRCLNDNAELFHQAQVQPAEIALVFSLNTYLADWAQHRNCQLSVDCLSGYYRMLWEQSIPVDVVHEEYLWDGGLNPYKIVILPNPVAVAAEAIEPLREYVEGGGVLLSDPYLCAMSPHGALASEVPGADFAEVFGCRERDITSARNRTVNLMMEGRLVPVTGSHLQAFWNVAESAEVPASYETGEPAVVSNRFGEGRAMLSGLNLGLAYSTRQGVGDDFTREGAAATEGHLRQIVLDAVRQAGVRAPLTTPPDVRAGLLSTADGRHVLIAINTADAPREGEVRLSDVTVTEARSLLEGGTQVAVQSGAIPLRFSPYESKVLVVS